MEALKSKTCKSFYFTDYINGDALPSLLFFVEKANRVIVEFNAYWYGPAP